MQVCDLCQRTDKQARCDPAVIGLGESIAYIGNHCTSSKIWEGHLCGDCRKRVADSLRTLVPSPAPDAAPFATPTPKQAYVLDPRSAYVAVLVAALLAIAVLGGFALTHLQH